MENRERYLVGIDFETANSSPLSACSVGVVVFEAGEVVYEFESLIKPPKKYDEFKAFNTTIHHIEKEDVVNADSWDKVFFKIKKYLDNSLMVAHNANFDMTVLKSLNKFYNIKLPKASYFCSVQLSRQILPYLKNHKLNTVSDFLKISLNHHNAKSDAIASAMIVYKCMIMTKNNQLLTLLENVNIKLKKLN